MSREQFIKGAELCVDIWRDKYNYQNKGSRVTAITVPHLHKHRRRRRRRRETDANISDKRRVELSVQDLLFV